MWTLSAEFGGTVLALLCAAVCISVVVMDGLKPPGELSFEGNVSENWRRWKRSFQNYLLAINICLLPNEDDGSVPAANASINKRQVALLLHCAGEEAYEIFSQFEYEGGESADKLDDVVAKFEAYCNPRKHILYETFVFWSMVQSDGESIDLFVKRLKTQAAKCEFGVLLQRMLLCRVIFGLKTDKLKERLLRDSKIDLNRAMDDIRASEITRHQLSKMADGDKTSMDAVGAEKSFHSAGAGGNMKDSVKNCKFCTFDHPRGKCPAYGKKCHSCGGRNHFEKACSGNKQRSVKTVESDVDKQVETLFIGMVNACKSSKSWYETLQLKSNREHTSVPFKIDTGAQANAITKDIAKLLRAPIKPSSVRLRGYNNASIANHGYVELLVGCQGSHEMQRFEVVDDGLCPILGLESSELLGIVNRINEMKTTDLLDKYSDVFEGIGCLSGEHDISVDPSVKPVIHAPRRVPISMTDKLKKELDDMEKSGIIAKVDVPTPWVNSLVCVEKRDGSLRICLDPKDLNKAVMREHHKIPTMEDIAFRFTGMKYFTILDMKHGYWHIPLSKESSLLTTFNTPFGRYCYRRLPFGLHSSAEVFEKRVEQVFDGVPVAIYFDDLIVAGRTQQEHDDNLEKLLVRARECNVKFNRKKIQLNQSQVKYLGHIVSVEGLKPDPDKLEAIDNMPNPTDKQGIQRVLGVLNFLRSYIPNMSALTEPLRELLKTDEWTWGTAQEESMTMIKRLLTSKPILRYFDVSADVELQVDASKSGLGAVLLQNGHPVSYASRALTDAECNWPQIDKELLAIVFGCERFHSYLYGRPLDVQTDHKPLVSIVNKPLQMASPRLQRLLLRLQRYDVKNIKYVPGRYLYIADTLSRAYLQKITNDQMELESEVVMVHNLEITNEHEERLVTAYKEDPVMQDLMKAVLSGWTWQSRTLAPEAVKPYWNVRDELYEQAGLLYVGERLVIPHKERRRYLDLIHSGHLGIQKCRERAKRSMFWPGLSNDIQIEVSNCSTCTRFSNRQPREPLIPMDIPELPWSRVAMDILEFKSHNYLVVVDCYSHFPELRILKNKKADDVIMALKSVFSVHGIPIQIMADNMPFNSLKMRDFSKDWSFEIVTSSPHYPRSNGLAERYVQTMKQFLKKCEATNEDVYRSLLAYRETAVSGCPYSPAEMLFNRSIRSSIPRTTDSLRPHVKDGHQYLMDNRNKQKEHYDRSTRPLPDLQPGDRAYVRTEEQSDWRPATVVAEHSAPRSYLVDNGANIVRRNRAHIKSSNAPETTGDVELPSTNTEGRQTGITPAPVVSRSAHTVPAVPDVRSPRTPRSTRGVLPPKFGDYVMN